ncbi:uncharacterized protein LOC114168441 [Vigna unguiculata]|uniref:uncharacterized protein LOC114168441 n=1 Tax=Vigna unguiculata TaxID=3917 RepID=UPI00101688E1|nr:uncharacterized protein LOC114168441 [Vigna unguiculata]
MLLSNSFCHTFFLIFSLSGDNRQAEEESEKQVIAKKQKIEEVVQKQKKETKLQKKKESNSDDSSSNEKPGAKNGFVAAASSSSDSFGESSDENDVSNTFHHISTGESQLKLFGIFCLLKYLPFLFSGYCFMVPKTKVWSLLQGKI